MAGTRFQSNRPFTAPVLEMLIRETPVVGDQPEGVFPDRIIFGDTPLEEAVMEDVVGAFEEAGVEEVDSGDIEVDESKSFTRGMGEFTDVRIQVNVKDTIPEGLVTAQDILIDQGYMFADTRLK